MSAQEPGTELVLAHTGEIVNLEDEAEVAKAYREVHALDRQLYEAKRRLREAMGERAKVLGTKTIYVEGVGKVEVKGGEEKIYDEHAIEEELRELGCPEDVIREIIIETVSWKIDAVRAGRAARANPDYAAVIDRHTTIRETLPTISIS